VIRSVAHTAVCVPDLDAAIRWYESALGLVVLAPPVLMKGEAIERDMGELVPGIVMRAAILGFERQGDNVLEVIEYPEHRGRPRAPDAALTDHGFSHVGFVCADLTATRAELEARGVEFLTRGIADIAGLRTTWFRDPYGTVFILMEKCTDPGKPYFRQMSLADLRKGG
jgi:methylmalonyl-CoA/ethylmalonyl-CoA epimerase